MWLVDSGMTDLLGKPAKIQSPSVFVFNLNDNKLIKRFEIPKSQMKENSFFVNIVSIAVESEEESWKREKVPLTPSKLSSATS